MATFRIVARTVGTELFHIEAETEEEAIDLLFDDLADTPPSGDHEWDVEGIDSIERND